MPLSLDDLRKKTSVSRRDKQRFVTPILIETAEERELAFDFCRYFAEVAAHAKRQRDFSEQYLIERAGGDFKLARGLISAMLGFYTWESESFDERLPAEDFARLQEMGLARPGALRLALYDYVNSGERSGFVTSRERAEVLELFAAGVGLEPELVDELLYLDAEENALLKLRTRQDGESYRSPTADEVVRRYNRMAVEALLYNATEIIFSFGMTLPGLLIKRIGYYSKEFQIPFDLDYNASGEVQLRLYGPAQAFGPPTKHSERLARLTFIILALARRVAASENGAATETFSGPRTSVLEPAPGGRKKSATSPAQVTDRLANLIHSATAQVYIRDKTFYFNVSAVAQYLAPAEKVELEEIAEEAQEEAMPESGSNLALHEATVPYTVAKPFDTAAYFKQKEATRREFDSAVEADFYQEFVALAREGHTAGWQIEREPDAIALPHHNLIFIPDFAFQRGSERVYLEVIGFWTPEYRNRKLEKLEKLKRYGDYKLLLAVAQELKAEFNEGPHGEKRELHFPAVYYKNRLRPTEIVTLLQKEYDDRAGRLELVGAARSGVESLLVEQGFVPERELYGLLQVYNKTELLAALMKLEASAVYAEGYGLCSELYLQASGAALEDSLNRQERLSLEEAAAALSIAGLTVDTPAIEALVNVLPGIEVSRPSLFEIYVQREGTALEVPLMAMPVPKSRRARR
ncbi:MAG TPA: DUF790 family protein [Chloroflexia bacterium]|nr:DUF790 family protein [Chloroflexia bacterium]